MRVNNGMISPGGPHFEVAPGVTLQAHTFELLYPMITDWRIRHGIPPGDVRADVDQFVCSRWPHACLPDDKDGPTQQMRANSIASRVATWAALKIRAMPPGGYDLVDEIEAKRRATICLGCPYKKSWKSRCGSCDSSTEAILASVRRLRNISFDNSIFACEVSGQDNPTAIHLPLSAVTPSPEIVERLAPGCWMRDK